MIVCCVYELRLERHCDLIINLKLLLPLLKVLDSIMNEAKGHVVLESAVGTCGSINNRRINAGHISFVLASLYIKMSADKVPRAQC